MPSVKKLRRNFGPSVQHALGLNSLLGLVVMEGLFFVVVNSEEVVD